MNNGRRLFLRHLAAGSTVVSMPFFAAACGTIPAMTSEAEVPENPFLSWFGIDNATIARVMAALTSNGADAAELYFQHRQSCELALAHGAISSTAANIEQGVGVRVVIDGQVGFSCTEELTLPSMLAAARAAAAVANAARVLPPQRYETQEAGGLYRVELPWSEVGMHRKVPVLQRVDSVARAADASIGNVSVSWADSDERVLIATLDGQLVTDHRPMTRLSAQVMASRNGEVQSGFASIAAREGLGWYTGERIDRMVQEAVDRTLLQFDARRPPVGELPVILAAGNSGVVLHEAIGHAMEADFNRDGTSVYADRIGETVAAPAVNVVDQGTLPHERGALNYDDEGHRCGRTVLVENGTLRSYLHDAISARHYGVPLTGNGRRQSYRFAPMPRMTCTFMEDGPHSREEIIASVDRGVIAETYTDGRVQIGAGDFSFYVKNGWLVESGKVTAPIRDFTLRGNGPELLRRIALVGNDARLDTGGWICGKHGQQVPVSQGLPTVLVSRLTVAGGGDT